VRKGIPQRLGYKKFEHPTLLSEKRKNRTAWNQPSRKEICLNHAKDKNTRDETVNTPNRDITN
jgi:hypothetical protein